MRKLICVVCSLLILGTGCAVFAAEGNATEGATNPVLTENKSAIGIGDFPWDLDGGTEVSLKWWKDQNHGKQLVLGGAAYYQTEYTTGNRYDNEREENGWDLSGFRYYWLKRERVGKLDNIYGIWGKGVGLYYSSSQYTTGDSDYRNEVQRNNYELTFLVPIGVEHFFVKSCPNISYSIQVDLRGSLRYREDTTNNYSSRWKTTDTISYFGATPKFAINYYFK